MRYDFSGHLSLHLCHGPQDRERERETVQLNLMRGQMFLPGVVVIGFRCYVKIKEEKKLRDNMDVIFSSMMIWESE